MFLKKIKVNRFCEIKKTNTFFKKRILVLKENDKKDDVFYILKKTTVKEGECQYINEIGYIFNHKKTHKVYVVSNQLNKQYLVLLEDVVFVNEED